MNELIPLKRNSTDLIFFGLKGSGKTIAISYYLYVEYVKGRNIYANFHLNFPFTYVKELTDVKNAHDGIICFDDAESVITSKYVKSTQQRGIFEILLNTGKKNCDCWFLLKRPLEANKSIRTLCDKFIFVRKELMLENMYSEEEYDFKKQYLNFYRIVLESYDRNNLNEPEMIECITDLDIWCQLYDTQEEVKELKR